MKLAFAGTPAFAATALQALLAESRHGVCAVLTQPDRPAGRGLRPQPSPVKQLALAHGLTLLQPPGLRLDGRHADAARAARRELSALDPELIVVAAYGLILPRWLLELPWYGCLNIHASLLPRWRGAAPIQRAIEAGDRETGITVMQMDAGLDTGDVLLRAPLAIADDDSAATLHNRLAVLGAGLIVDALARLERGALTATPQGDAGVTYAHKIDKHEAPIDWRDPAAQIERRIRAFDPFPGAHFEHRGVTVKVWRALVRPPSGAAAAPGTVLSAPPGPLVVACGDGAALELRLLQRPGGRRVAATQCFGAGQAPAPGERLPLPARTPPEAPSAPTRD